MKQFIIVLVALATVQPAFSQNVGIGTTSPGDKLHINAPSGVDPFRVDINNNTKLRVWADGGVSIGSLAPPPADGLLVQGTLQPQNNISTPNKMYIESTADSMVIKAGGSRVIIAPNGDITIETDGTSTLNIESNGNLFVEAQGNLNLKGAAVNLEAAGNLTIKGTTINQIASTNISLNAVSINQAASGSIGLAAATINQNASATVAINGAIITLNGGGRPLARLADLVSGNTIISGSPTVFTN
ncbi:MAG TPA: hypothetical protein VGO58_15810 [Chitinophagaceae bacterium]|jgi:hypothetical protein|nr:hypothetical protein [Chitinophagaceae bacterium]